jgi:DNA processing protein
VTTGDPADGGADGRANDPTVGPAVDPVPDSAAEPPIEHALDPAIVRARAYLSRVAEPGSLAVAAFVGEHGPVESSLRIRRGLVPPSVLAATEARRTSTDADADLDAAGRHRITLVTPESVQWPHFAFAPLYAAQERRIRSWAEGQTSARYGGEPTVPLALWVRGPLALAELATRSVAIVGARAATAYGASVALDLAYGLAATGVTVVSGGAFGIDAAAHRGALSADGPTVLVSAGGLDRPYPVAHGSLYEQVAWSGLLVSESPPGSAPQKHRFLSRNRLIAAFATGTVVVEAAPRSGALNTAAHCVLLGRPLMAVPGPVTSTMSDGCHALIRRENEPAVLVASVAHVLDYVGSVGSAVDTTEPQRTVHRHDALDPQARSVLDGMPARDWLSSDDLSRRSGIPVVQVIRALPVLRMAGLIESERGRHRLTRAPAVRVGP